MRTTRARLALLAALCAAPGGSGCYTARHAYSGPKLLTTGPGLGAEARVVHHFREHDRQFFLAYGLVPIGKPANGAELAAEQAGEHDGVVNLRLSDGQDLLDMFVSNILCVASVLCGTWSVWAEGDVVQITGPSEQVWIEPHSPDVASPAPERDAYVPVLALEEEAR